MFKSLSSVLSQAGNSTDVTKASAPFLTSLFGSQQAGVLDWLTLKIGGYTDNTGDQSANMSLSRSRAQNTMSAIATQGVSTSRLEAEGYGEQHPVVSNDTEEGRQRNRRVDVLVTAK